MTEKKKATEKKEEKAPEEDEKKEVKAEKKPKARKVSKKEETKGEEEAPEEKKPKAKKAPKKEASKEEKSSKPVEEKTEPNEKVESTPAEKGSDRAIADLKEAPAGETPSDEKKVKGASEDAQEASAEEIIETPEEGSEEGVKEDEEVTKQRSGRKKSDKGEEGPFPEELMFGKYSTREIVVEDPSLKAFINLDPALVPHSSSRHANKPFHKHKISIVERLINNLMRTENYTGKKAKSYKAVLDAFILIEKRMKENPIQILVRAIENSAPREEVTRLKFGGISVPKAVDTAPARRLDIALRNISIGTVKATHKNRKSVAECLASELISASKGDLQSYGVSKRDELERVAKSAH